MARFRLSRLFMQFGHVGPTNAISEYPILDDDRSQFPYDLNSGYGAFSATTLFTSILGANFVSGASGQNFWFKPETLMITNKQGTTNEVIFYDGQSVSVGVRSVWDIILKPSDTLFMTKDLMRGVFFISGVFVSNLNSGITVRIGGKLLQSIPGQL